MGLMDRLGTGMTRWLYPFLQEQTNFRGDKMPKNILDFQEFQIRENYLWFLGNEDLLADFYQTKTNRITTIDTRDSFFYSHVDGEIRVVHSGMPSLISYSRATLLMSGGVDQFVQENEEVDEDTTDLLDDILIDNKMNFINKSAATTESWGKKFAYKLSFDPDITEFPIIEKFIPLNYESIKKRGRQHELIFKTTFQFDKEAFELQEIYGFGYIRYKLFKKKESKLIEVPITTLEETKDLEEFTFDSNIMLALEKEIDKSDYRGIISEFDALDETWSQLMDEIRLGRAETYVPDILAFGKTFDSFRKKHVVTGTDDREGSKNEITHNQAEIRVEQYTMAGVAIRDNILANVKLSPLTLGFNEKVGANSSQEAITTRELTSLRNRRDMIPEWEQFLEEFYEITLNANTIFRDPTAKAIEYDVEVIFGDYVTPTREAVIANAKELVDSDIIDNERALDEVYGDELTEEEKIRILSNTGALISEDIAEDIVEDEIGD